MRPAAARKPRGTGISPIGAALIIVVAAQCSTVPARVQPDASPASPPAAGRAQVEEEPEEIPGRNEPGPPPEPSDDGTEEAYHWGQQNREGGRDQADPESYAVREDPTATAGGALTIFMRSRNYRTIRILRSVMTPALAASYDRNSARFNGKQNVRLAAFYFKEEDLKKVRRTDAYDATVRSLWTDQGEVAERRTELIRVTREESGLWRAGRLDIQEADRHRYQEQIPSVTSLRKVLRDWHRRRPEAAVPHLSKGFLERFGEESDAGDQEEFSPLHEIFVGDPYLRHAAFRILEIDWVDDEPQATAYVELYVTARNRFGDLEANYRRIGMVREGVGWYVDSWEEIKAADLPDPEAGESGPAGL